jgi:RNA polymerase sigma factor (sigma-70 family)
MELRARSGHDVVVDGDRLSDRELWALAVAGDPERFGTLFERHARAVYNFCFRRTGSWTAAEDLTSEVFLLAWRRRREVVFTTDGGSVLPWCMGVALNLLRNRRRSDRRASAAFARLDAGASESDFSDEVVERLADERQMREVLAVFDRLAPHEQEVLSLCAWAGLDYEGCAVALGVPVGTIRSRLSRARAHLRELLELDGHEHCGDHLRLECVADERIA